MAQIRRQSELFSAEDWTVIYRAFSDINFNAYDFDTIRQSMIDYIRFNFPEDFNDWIESSEFVALVDLMAYLGQSLAFRMDLNTRENFIDTAERKESLLRMGRLLSYQPTRNIGSSGLLKVVAIRTSERIVDSLGQNLQNANIVWNDANNPDFFEQWSLIMNSAFQTTNPFGQPVKNGIVNNIPTDLYAIDTDPVDVGQYPFSANTNQGSFNFEIVNVDFNETTGFTERNPTPDYTSHIIYRNDGNGNSSANTGFFMYFKQGTLNFRDFNLSVPIENRVININTPNINNFDVFVQSINGDGTPFTNWTPVPAIVGNNVIFNSLVNNINDIFSVITRDNDQISLRFGDGVFGNVPTGTLRSYYRVSANQLFDIKPSNMRGVQISIPYFNARGDSHSLTLVMNLQETVSNSAISESIDQIRERAPQVFYTQNRMVNGEDYNVFPLQDTRILKLKALNRTYSGHSRFIDLNDPTSTSQSVKVIADDGMFYQEPNDFYTEIPLSSNKTSAEIITETVNPALLDRELQQFYYEIFPYVDATLGTLDPDPTNPRIIKGNDEDLEWTQASDLAFSSTGFFNVSGNTSAIQIGPIDTVDQTRNYIDEGAIIEFEDPNTAAKNWVAVQSVTNNGSDGGDGIFASGKGRVTLAEPVITGSKVITVFPSFRNTLILSEINAVRAEIDNEETFGLRFDAVNQNWVIITAANISPVSTPFSLDNAGNVDLQNLDASWLLRMDFSGDVWKVRARGLRFIWESVRDVRFFVNQFRKVQGLLAGRVSSDTITIPSTVAQPNNPAIGLGEDIKMAVTDVFLYPDGFQEPRRVIVSYTDLDEDGIPDDPSIFVKAVEEGVTTSPFVFHEVVTNLDQTETEIPIFTIVSVPGINATDPLPNAEDRSKIVQGTIVYNATDGAFYEYTNASTDDLDKTILGNYTLTLRVFKARTGRSGMRFIWKHIADRDRRIDPAITNIIDLYALTEGYDIEYRRFIAGTKPVGPSNPAPLPPTSEELRRDFNFFDTNKMVSDTLVWRPVEYVTLFGDRAEAEVRAKFKIIKVQGTDVSDGELKTRVINSINEFFDVTRWDVGDTFYASELQAFIHLQNATVVGGVEIVPLNDESRFGQLEEIRLETNQLFISSARVTDVDIVENFNKSTLRIGI